MAAVLEGENRQGNSEAEVARERAAFERWVQTLSREWDPARFGPEHPWAGQYRDYAVQLAWGAWLERSKR